MRSLEQLCKPRQSVFDRNRRDVVLDLTGLLEDRIDPGEFFEENYFTTGMKRLLQEAFRRFAGTSPQGVFVLTQAMGGGKTHNMIALRLLAKHPELRQAVLGDLYNVEQKLGAVRVVAFTGRESDAPLGLWGAIAGQLGKKELFKDYYSPLAAPGQTAWINLLKGDPLLILLDELPPYFENARAKPVGNSDLAVVTTTALANLLVAVGKGELANVCVVLSDLKATYAGGSAQINRALEDLTHEVGRSALTLEPVGLNTDEIYHILRKRLFQDLPEDKEVWEVARAYAQAVRDARQMDITSASPEKFAQLLKESYPFHFAIRDLYARFRENPGFQQTRGLIRLMRVMVSRLFDPQYGQAGRLALIHAHNLDLNDRETLAEVSLINPTLDNAISHDIASNGQAIAEIMDANLGGTDAQDVCKLLLVAPLANVPNAIVGLSISERSSPTSALQAATFRSCPGILLASCLPGPGIYTPIATASCISRTSRTWWQSSRPLRGPTTANRP
jgi:predicted AAA+ superfamily ATPase